MNGRLAHFEALHERSDDPWRVRSRWYEQRKRSLTLGALPRRHYRCGFEPGCSIGVLSAALAERCDHLECWDPSAAAVRRARAALDGRSGVRVARRALPAPLPRRHFDLVVLSEVGYYLTRDGLGAAIDDIVASLAPDADVLACHWRHGLADGEQDGASVHRQINARIGLPRRTRITDREFVLDVWSSAGDGETGRGYAR